jgi:hypothetical protein
MEPAAAAAAAETTSVCYSHGNTGMQYKVSGTQSRRFAWTN